MLLESRIGVSATTLHLSTLDQTILAMKNTYGFTLFLVSAVFILWLSGCDSGLNSPDVTGRSSTDQAEASGQGTVPNIPTPLSTGPCAFNFHPTLSEIECEIIQSSLHTMNAQGIGHPDCYRLFMAAWSRFETPGGYAKGSGSSSNILGYIYWSSPGSSSTTGVTYITESGFGMETEKTIFHEEGHHAGYRHGQTWGGRDPEGWAQFCGMNILL